MGSSNYRFVHGVSIAHDHRSAVIANVKDVNTNESRIQIFTNPRRPFWITKPEYRNHDFSREAAPERELDMYVVEQHDLAPAIQRALTANGRRSSPGYKPTVHMLCKNPYVYGADIDPMVILKSRMSKACPTAPTQYHTGHLDIESSVTGTDEINVITYVDGKTRTCYIAVLQAFLNPEHNEQHLREVYAQRCGEFRSRLNNKAQAIFDEKPFKLVFHITADEVDLIKWTFKNIHECMPDFIGIWNIDYDIPRIIDRLLIHGVPLTDVFCHPSVPEQWRVTEYKRDERTDKKAHWSRKWHWLTATSGTQFIDSMSLYSRIRIPKGIMESYTLDFTAETLLGTGKLSFGDADHTIMQTTRFDEYVIYNCFDSIVLYLMEQIEGDITKMVELVGDGLLQDFARNTVQIKNFAYLYCRENGMVLGSSSGKMTREGDEDIPNVGGAVLPPQLAVGTGIPIIAESDMETNLHIMICDLDVRSMYPSFLMGGNISRGTKLHTVLSIEGEPVESILDFFANAPDPSTNGVYLGHKYFGLPDFQEMQQLAQKAITAGTLSPNV